MYHFWRQNPLFRPALGFALGIFIQDSLSLSNFIILCLFGGLFLGILSSFWTGYRRVTLAPFLWFLILGIGFHSLQPKAEKIDHSPNFYLTTLSSSPKCTEKSCQVEAQLIPFDRGGSYAIKVKISLPKTSLSSELLHGDRLLVYGSIYPVSGPSNPHTFNYAQFLKRKGIFHQIYVKEKAWKKIGQQAGLIRYAHIWRNWALEAITQSIENPESAGILKALLCGDTRELDSEVRNSYAQSGTMHILAVSGMHVGILLVIIQFILGNGRLTLIRNLLILVMLWMYAFITGLSPSVMRAVSMASFYLIGEIFSREHSTWNSVAFALLALLIYDTHNLYSPGFQLSFLALSGILCISGKRPSNNHIKTRIIHWFKSFFWVSIAAQAATSPIAIYYFEQFPVYFLLGNLMIVPLAAPIMYSGILLLMLYALNLGWKTMGVWVEKLLDFCHWLAQTISDLPGAKLGGLDWDIGLVACAYLLLLGIVMYDKIKSLDLLYMGTICFCFWLISDVYSLLERKNQEGIIVYSLNKKTYFDYYKGSAHLSLGDSLDNRDSLNLQAFRKAKRLSKEITTPQKEFDWGEEISTENLRIVRYKGNKSCIFPTSQKPTVLILEKYSSGDLKSLHDSLKFCNIVLASNLGWKARENWIQQAKELGLTYHDLREQGAYEKEIWNHSFITKLKTGLDISRLIARINATP